MNKKQIREAIGKIGEDVVAKTIPGAVKTGDWYDSEKDGTINGNLTYEVKTLTRRRNEQAFWLSPKEGERAANVNILFIIESPAEPTDPAVLYMVMDHSRTYDIIEDRIAGTQYQWPVEKCMTMKSFDGFQLYNLAKQLRN